MQIIAILVFITGIFAAVLFAGVTFWIKRQGPAIGLLYAGTVALVWWAAHYFNQLSWDDQGDLLWHKRYTLIILILGPLVIGLSALIGYRIRMKKYFETGGTVD